MSRGRWQLPPSWARIRKAILERDGFRCYVCGALGADEVDHVVPRSRGGSDDPNNLRAVHARPCHERKSNIESHAPKPKRRREPERHPGLIIRARVDRGGVPEKTIARLHRGPRRGTSLENPGQGVA